MPSSVFKALALLPLLGFAAAQNSPTLPIVDLGYELHQANYFNETGGFYNFSNIRYAAPPVGNLRFAAPQLPAVNRSEVQTGDVGRVCPQASPAWGAIARQFIPNYLQGLPFNASATSSNSSSASGLPSQDPRTTEDCLFLDVIVPRQVLESAGMGFGAPVLVWIYGGGYTAGDKSGINGGSAAGLIKRGNESVIYVALNYRLGAFGWLSGPTFQANGTANAGLLDQRLALDWIKAYIPFFGGDPNRVTVFGESAGGGSIMHHITAYGGVAGPAPFQQAILQSPGFLPVTSNIQQETIFNNFLQLLNVSTIQQARQLPSSALITANLMQVGLQSPYGAFTYGPVVDGAYTPKLPGELLLHGQFDKSVRVMVGHNANEGLLFTSPFIQNETAFTAFIRQSLPAAQPAIVNYIANTLYPPVFNGSYPYKDEISRVAFAISELSFVCNTYFLDTAYRNRTYSYFFSVPPALHGQDVPYTYYNDGGRSSSVQNVTVALALQNFITSFAELGRPVGQQGIPAFHMWGPNATVINLNLTTISEGRDNAANARCAWWQKALYY